MSPANRSLLVGLVVGVVAVAAGLVVAWATFPDSDEMRADSFADFGLDPALARSPLVDQVLDRLTERTEDRIADDARRSAAAGVVTAGAAAAVGVAVASTARSRPRNEPAAPTGPPDAADGPPPGSF